MSKIGKLPVAIPAGVTVTVNAGEIVVKGPKGELKQHVNDKVNFEVKDGELTVSPVDESKAAGAAHGLYRALVHNMVTGVTQGFSKSLIITGVGYRAEVQGKNLVMNLGFSSDFIAMLMVKLLLLVLTSSWLVNLLHRSANFVSQNLTREREFVTATKLSDAKSERLV